MLCPITSHCITYVTLLRATFHHLMLHHVLHTEVRSLPNGRLSALSAKVLWLPRDFWKHILWCQGSTESVPVYFGHNVVSFNSIDTIWRYVRWQQWTIMLNGRQDGKNFVDSRAATTCVWISRVVQTGNHLDQRASNDKSCSSLIFQCDNGKQCCL